MMTWEQGMMGMMSVLLYTLLGLVGDILTVSVVENITLSCSNISSSHGYLYPVLPNVRNLLLNNNDCEQAWHTKAMEILSDGTPLRFMNQTRHRLVADVHKNNITVTKCIDLQHQVTCHGLEQKFEVTYQVINDTMLSQGIKQESHKSIVVSALIPAFVVVVLIIIALVLIRIRCNRNQSVEHAENANSNGVVSDGALNGAAQPQTRDTAV